jgi:hypothetical protein
MNKKRRVMRTPMIDITKKYETREGYEVRIYATDGCGDDPVHGAIKFYDGWYMAKWTATGKKNLNEYDDDDLFEVIAITALEEDRA